MTMGRGALAGLIGLSALAGLAAGMFNPLIAALLTRAGVDEFGVGLVSTLFFVALAAAAPLASRLILRFGPKPVIAVGLVVAGLSGAVMPRGDGLAAWALLRATTGAGVALYMIGSQTALNSLASDARRSMLNGLQALAFGVGLGAGPMAGALLERFSPAIAFGVAGGVLLLALPWVVLTLPTFGRLPVERSQPVVGRIRLALHAAFAYGAAEASLLALYPVFLLHGGADLAAVGLAFAAFVIGSLLATMPLAWLADALGQGTVIAGCAVAAVVCTLMLGEAAPGRVWLWSGLCGASVGPVYALALADIGRRLGAHELASGNAAFTVMFSLGSMVAPVLTGWLMREYGDGQVFSVTIVLFASLCAHRLVAAAGSGRTADLRA